MNSLQGLADVLERGGNEIQVDPALGLQARRCIDRMLDFTAIKVQGSSNSAPKLSAGLVPNIGAA